MPLIAESSLLRRILAPPGAEPGAGSAATPAPPGTPFQPPAASKAPLSPPLGPGVPDLPLEEILRRRESVRSFADRPISRHELEVIIRSGMQAERSQWPPDAHPDVGVTIAAAAFSVDGLNPGLYLPAPALLFPPPRSAPAPALLFPPPRSAPTPAEAAFFAGAPDGGLLAGLPERYVPAPVLLLVCGDLTRASATMGAQGYPRLLVRAGAAGYGAWLRAVSIGLAGCPFGAANHQITTVVSRLSGGSLRHLFTIAIGRARGTKDTHDH